MTAMRIAASKAVTRRPVLEHIVTDAAETFVWRCDDYPWERNVWNIHPEYEIHLVRNAAGVALVGDHIEPFDPGYLAIVGGGLPHDWVTATAPGEIIRGRDIVLQFDPDRVRKAAAMFPEIAALGPFLTAALRGLAFHGETRRRGAELLEAMGRVTGLERLTLFFRLLHVLSTGEYRVLSSRDFAPDTDDATQTTIQSALTYILANFTRDIHLPDLARRLNMSQWAFSRFFKKNSGNSFTDYVTTLRLGYACKLLADSEMPVTDICFEIGYANVSNFNRAFRSRRGMTPLGYRRLARQRVTQRGAQAAPHAMADTLMQVGGSNGPLLRRTTQESIETPHSES
jgi:AraC-like DNA-binding protein